MTRKLWQKRETFQQTLSKITAVFKSSYRIYRIPQKDAAATLYFSTTAMQRLFEGGAYSRAAFNSITGAHV